MCYPALRVEGSIGSCSNFLSHLDLCNYVRLCYHRVWARSLLSDDLTAGICHAFGPGSNFSQRGLLDMHQPQDAKLGLTETHSFDKSVNTLYCPYPTNIEYSRCGVLY